MALPSVKILGGHGKIALILAKHLAQAGYPVTSLFRNKDHTDDIKATGATPKVFNLEAASLDDFVKEFKGTDVIVWSAGAGGGSAARTYAVDRDATIESIKAAEKAGVKRYILVSYLDAKFDHGVPPDNSFFAYAESKAASDDFLRKSSLDWTILAPGALSLKPASGKIEFNPQKKEGRDVSRENVALALFETIKHANTIHKDVPFLDGDEPIEQVFNRI